MTVPAPTNAATLWTIASGDLAIEGLARLLDGKPGEQVELSDPRRNRVLLPEPGEQFIQRQDEVGILRDGTDLIE